MRVIVQRPESGCVPSRALLDAVPLLATGYRDEPPAAVAEAMAAEGARNTWRRWARLGVDTEEFELWVVANLPCDNARQREGEACLVAVRRAEQPRVLCIRPGETGSSLAFPGAGGVTIAGFAPPSTGSVTVTRPRTTPVRLTAVGGVFGTVLPLRFGTTGDKIDVTFAKGPDVALLNATPQKGLAAATGRLLPGVELIGNYRDQQRPRSTVFYTAEDARYDAKEVARLLRIADIRPAPPDTVALASGARVIVVLGEDRLPS